MRDYKKYVRSTILKNCLSDKMKAYDMIHNPDIVPGLSNAAALEMGTLIHLLLLEPENFYNKIACVEYTRRGDKRHQEALDANPDKILVKADVLEEAVTATRRSLCSSKVKTLLHHKANLYEQTLTADYDNFSLVAQPDIYNPETKTLVDVKTTGQRIQRVQDWYYICDRLKYLCQMTHYKKVLELLGKEVDHVCMFVQEVKYPYAHKIYSLNDKALEDGLLQWETALDIYKELRESTEFFESDEDELGGKRDNMVDMSQFWT